MRILLASSNSGSRGGGELFLLSLASALSASGHEVILWASQHSRMDELCARFREFGPVERSLYANTYDRRFRVMSALLDSAVSRRVATEWRSLGPEVIHLNKQNLEDGLDLVDALARTHLPAVCTIHVTQSAAYLKAKFARLRDLVARWTLRKINARLVAVGKSRAEDLARFLQRPADQITCIPNGVPIPSPEQLLRNRAEYRNRLDAKPDEVVFLAVGRMVSQKRPLLFLQVAQMILRNMANARFCWLGDGPLKPEWDRTVQHLGLAEKISAPGWVADPGPFYAASDVFLHLAAFEGLPLAVLEAMAAGLPCCLTPNLIAEFGNSQGLVSIDCENPGWLEELQKQVRRRYLGDLVRKSAIELFSVERMASDYLDLYREAQC
ncbi:MAG: glycosyltransferase family 4 protein [Verrucomicrobia bacterium]|nr:glycosyltransferase family 4 protein [Verrucomicrobiota bacterium]